jgi:hypothetical protein
MPPGRGSKTKILKAGGAKGGMRRCWGLAGVLSSPQIAEEAGTGAQTVEVAHAFRISVSSTAGFGG